MNETIVKERWLICTNFFSGVVHELVVYTTQYFPVTREGRMRDDEVTGRITISISYFGVMDTGAISRGGLGFDLSTISQRRGVRNGSHLNHYFIGTVAIGNEVGLDQRTEPKPLPFLVWFLWQGVCDRAHLGAARQPRVSISRKTEHHTLPSIKLKYIDTL